MNTAEAVLLWILPNRIHFRSGLRFFIGVLIDA